MSLNNDVEATPKMCEEAFLNIFSSPPTSGKAIQNPEQEDSNKSIPASALVKGHEVTSKYEIYII